MRTDKIPEFPTAKKVAQRQQEILSTTMSAQPCEIAKQVVKGK
jgi:hypothetical protein